MLLGTLLIVLGVVGILCSLAWVLRLPTQSYLEAVLDILKGVGIILIVIIFYALIMYGIKLLI